MQADVVTEDVNLLMPEDVGPGVLPDCRGSDRGAGGGRSRVHDERGDGLGDGASHWVNDIVRARRALPPAAHRRGLLEVSRRMFVRVGAHAAEEEWLVQYFVECDRASQGSIFSPRRLACCFLSALP